MTCAAVSAELPVTSGFRYCADAIEVDSSGVYGPEHQCFAEGPAAANGAVRLACEDEYNPPYVLNATVVEDAAAPQFNDPFGIR